MNSDETVIKKDYSSIIAASLQKRDERLEKLLKRLYFTDKLFERNVPVYFRETYTDEKLLTHLREAYSPLEFFVTDPDQMIRYIRSGDKAIAKRTITDETKFVKAYEPYFVTSISFDKKMMNLVKTAEYFSIKKPREISVPTENFSIIGTWHTFDSRYSFLEKNGMLNQMENEKNAIENFKKGTRIKDPTRKIKKKDVVIIEKDISFSEYYIPEGSEGVIAGHTYHRDMWIFWLPNPKLQVKIFQNFKKSPLRKTNKELFRPNETISMEDIILVKQNTVNFEKIYNEMYHPSEIS